MAAYILNFMPDVKTVGIIANDSPGAAAALPLVTKPLEAEGIDVTDVKVPSDPERLVGTVRLGAGQGRGRGLGRPAELRQPRPGSEGQQSDVTMVSVSSCYSADRARGHGRDRPERVGRQPVLRRPARDDAGRHDVSGRSWEVRPADANLSGFAPVVFTDMMTVYTNVLKPLGFEGRPPRRSSRR